MGDDSFYSDPKYLNLISPVIKSRAKQRFHSPSVYDCYAFLLSTNFSKVEINFLKPFISSRAFLIS